MRVRGVLVFCVVFLVPVVVDQSISRLLVPSGLIFIIQTGDVGFVHLVLIYHHHHHHRSLNREGRWGTTGDFATSFLHF